jgi:hypothetical protein
MIDAGVFLQIANQSQTVHIWFAIILDEISVEAPGHNLLAIFAYNLNQCANDIQFLARHLDSPLRLVASFLSLNPFPERHGNITAPVPALFAPTPG